MGQARLKGKTKEERKEAALAAGRKKRRKSPTAAEKREMFEEAVTRFGVYPPLRRIMCTLGEVTGRFM